MTTTVLSPLPVQKFFDNNGLPLAFGKLNTYQAGTNTPLATYTDQTGVTPNTNPIILNARGEANVWIPPNVLYKFVLTDSFNNTIWSVDQLTSSQLITLYGGVDTGIANAYSLTFAAPFSSYTDGIVIYWIPANTNTGNSTLNVNGLGNVSIVNGNGTQLTPGQITAGVIAQVMYKGGQFILLNSLVQGTATITLSGVSGTVTTTVNYTITSGVCTIRIPTISGTSNSTSFSASFNQGALQPSIIPAQYISAITMLDNGTALYAQMASVNPGAVNSTNISFYKNGSSTGWTATGTKGIGSVASSFITLSYMLY